MKVTALRLHNVRRFAGRGIAIENISDGVNVLCEANEYGKSTCFDSLHALLFQSYSGTPALVQALRPYSGGSPLIEADITTEDGSFRLRKQFYGGKQARVTDLGSHRLIAQADEAEAFIRNLVRGGTSGPAGLLWVRQGNTGLERKTKADEDGEKQARETILTSVQGEVESVTGGRRMRFILETCESELGKLVTATYQPKTGGAYKAALTERSDLTERTTRLEADVEALHGALETRRRTRNRLRELNDPEQTASMQAAIRQAEQQLAATRLQFERRKAAEAEASLKRTQYDMAVTRRDTFLESLTQYSTVEAALKSREADHENARATHETARKNYEAALLEAEAAEHKEREARDHLNGLERTNGAHEAAKKLVQARDVLTQAEALRDEIETLEARQKARHLPPEAIDALAQLEQEITRLQALEAVRATTLHMAYDPAVTARVGINHTRLSDQADYPLTGTTALHLPGLGTLTVRPPERIDSADRAKKEAEHRQQLEALGIDSLASARQRQDELRNLKADIDLNRQKLKLLAPDGREALRQTIAALEAISHIETEVHGDINEASHIYKAAGEAVVATRLKVTEARPVSELAQKAFLAADAALSLLRSELARLDTFLGDALTREDVAQSLTERAAQLSTECEAAHALLDTLIQDAGNLENAEAALHRARSVLEAQAAEKSELLNIQSELNGRISAKSGHAIEEDLQESRDQLSIVEARVARFEHEIAVLRKLKDTLTLAKNDAREHYFAPVMSELRPLLGLMFDDATVTFDDETLLPRTIHRNGLEEQVPVLSGGMREQLAILTRLAFARLLAREGRPAPVILDDALVYSDDDRIEKMFDALHRQARDQQIIVFSCRQRAFSRLGGNRLRLTDWIPA